MISQFKNFILRQRTSGVCFIIFDCAGRNNVLNKAVFVELLQLLDQLKSDESVKGIGFFSGKHKHFCLGADLLNIYRNNDPALLYELIDLGQNGFAEISKFPKPVVMGINGSCFGGGLELILYSHYNIATDSFLTRFALPETSVGLIPALGGTQYLPKKVGYTNAFQMIIYNREIDSNLALKIGLVDKVVNPDNLLMNIENKVIELHKSQGFILKSNNPVFKLNLAKYFDKFDIKVQSESRLKAFNCIEFGIKNSFKKGLNLEKNYFVDLLKNPQTNKIIFQSMVYESIRQKNLIFCEKYRSQYLNFKIGFIGKLNLMFLYSVLRKKYNVNLVLTECTGDDLVLRHIKDVFGDQFSIKNDTADLANCDLIFISQDDFSVFHDLKQVNPNVIIVYNSIYNDFSKLDDQTNLFGINLLLDFKKSNLIEILVGKNYSKDSFELLSGFLKSLSINSIASYGSVTNNLIACYIISALGLLDKRYEIIEIENNCLGFGFKYSVGQVLNAIGYDNFYKILASSRYINLVDTEKLKFFVDSYISGFQQLSMKNIQHIDFAMSIKNDCLKTILYNLINETSYCLENKYFTRAKELDLFISRNLGFPTELIGPLYVCDGLDTNEIITFLKNYSNNLIKNAPVSDILLNYNDISVKFYN